MKAPKASDRTIKELEKLIKQYDAEMEDSDLKLGVEGQLHQTREHAPPVGQGRVCVWMGTPGTSSGPVWDGRAVIGRWLPDCPASPATG